MKKDGRQMRNSHEMTHVKEIEETHGQKESSTYL